MFLIKGTYNYNKGMKYHYRNINTVFISIKLSYSAERRI